MIPNVSRGDRMVGLLMYLAGAGKRNEHTDPHVVAGSAPVMAWWSETGLDRGDVVDLAHHLDAPRETFGVEVKQGHVWHCSLSLASSEGLLSDTQWEAIAQRFMQGMGFLDEGKAPVRWAAIRHGVSTQGNDHVHLAVQWVREDGTRCFIRNDYQRAQNVARDIEAEFGLQPLGAESHRERSYAPGEREAFARRSARDLAEREGVDWGSLGAAEKHARLVRELAPVEPRMQLALKVRAAAVAAQDEAEFVRRLRHAGVIVRPRFARGTTDVIEGYSVATRPPGTERAIWYGGGTLASDLSLPQLRQAWPDTAAGAASAAAEWSAAGRRRPPAAPGREVNEVTAADWSWTTQRLGSLHDQLSSVPVENTAEWARVARQLSGSLGAWAARVEPGHGPLTEAAITLGRCAQVRRSVPPKLSSPTLGAVGVAAALIGATRGGSGAAAQVAVLLQLMRLARKVYEVHQLQQDYRRSTALGNVYRQRLMPLVDDLQARVLLERQPQHGAARLPEPVPQLGAPVAQPLTPYRPTVTSEPTKGVQR